MIKSAASDHLDCIPSSLEMKTTKKAWLTISWFLTYQLKANHQSDNDDPWCFFFLVSSVIGKICGWWALFCICGLFSFRLPALPTEMVANTLLPKHKWSSQSHQRLWWPRPVDRFLLQIFFGRFQINYLTRIAEPRLDMGSGAFWAVLFLRAVSWSASHRRRVLVNLCLPE